MRKDLNRPRHFSIGIKVTILLFTIAILALVLFSYRSDKHGNLFWQVEKLMSRHPDSALVLLGKVTDINRLSLREKARYCLLLTESRDEAGLRHTSDSIISIATDYYRTTRGCYWPPKAWFYRGKVYEDMDQPSWALECYLRALEYEGENWDYEFWGRLYNQMGMLYAEQELYGKAMSFLRKASAQYQLLNDTAGQDRILTEVKKYEMLRDSVGSLSARESIYQITSRYDARPIREDLSKKELMLSQRGQERYLYAFIIGIILFISFLFYRRWRNTQENALRREEALRYSIACQQQRMREEKEEKDQELMLVSLQLEKQRLEICNESIHNEESKHLLSVAILRKSEVYEKFHDRDAGKVVSEDWELLEVLLNKAYDDFTLRLKKLYPVISDTELKACMLTKIGVPANQITRVLKYQEICEIYGILLEAKKYCYEKCKVSFYPILFEWCYCCCRFFVMRFFASGIILPFNRGYKRGDR
ncbi:MAG: tetratricopeptide repeat protein [Parabacteroides sp.]|nr:tetratricopeptide repeat protein [Parabacteroides sp.]